VKEKSPSLIFLIETRLSQNNASFLWSKLGYDHMFVVDCKGRSGRLILLWKLVFRVKIQNYSRRHVNAVVQLRNDGPSWKFTGFYHHLETAKRPEAWSLLKHLSQFSPTPWLCFGDFNEILCDAEKSSHTARPRWQMDAFQSTLFQCKLGDLGYFGPRYTWNNGRPGLDNTMERLERAVANSKWFLLFDVIEVLVLPRSVSDHNLLLVNFSNSADIKWPRRR
jgi:hypothetical protein